MSRPDPLSPPERERHLEASAEERARLESIEEELRALFFRLLGRHLEAIGTGGVPQEAVLELKLRVSAANSRQDPGQLARQLVRAATLYAEGSAVYPPGRVYCHWCRSFGCVHASPPGPRCVFGGYSATGQPLWPEYASVLQDRRDPRIGALFGPNPSPVALVQPGWQLVSEQLPVYGKRSPIYRILGQVAIGYLTVRRSTGERSAPFAMTLQVIETPQANAGLRGAPPATINALAFVEDGIPAYQLIEERFDRRLHDALNAARRKLAEIAVAPTSRRQRRERQKKVLDVLFRLARTVERIFRQDRRRTLHARERHGEPTRPASSAVSDALKARSEAVFRDIEAQTWVVVGPKNRVHVFNDRAEHVTSVVYPGETVKHRTTRGKWLSADPEQVRAFQETLRRLASGDTTSGPAEPQAGV